MTRWLIALALVGCSSNNGEKEALQLADDLTRDALTKIEAAMASGRPVDGVFQCVVTAGNEIMMTAGGEYAVRATKLQNLCDRDVPLAAIAKSVEAAEAARAKSPADKMLTACFVNDMKIALKSLKKRDDAKALLERFAIVCPDEKIE